LAFFALLASIFELFGLSRGWQPWKVELLDPYGVSQFKFPVASLLKVQTTKKSHQKIKKVLAKQLTGQ